MKARTRITGRLLSVSEAPIGTTLAADAAAGATSITVDDASVFDESGGTLFIGSQVLKYTGYDDDTGIVSLSSALTAAAEADDEVSRWSTLYNEVETAQTAQVAVEGDRDQADTLDVEVSDSLDLPSGERGGDGENCVLELDDDVWTLVSAKGRPSATRSLKFETNDSYVVTAADVTAGTLTMPLSQQPVSESLKLWWRATFQPPTEYTVNESGQTVTMPLIADVAAGDTIYVHYAYRSGLAPSGASPVGFTAVGVESTSATSGPPRTSEPWPAGTQAGDLFVLGLLGDSPDCADPRATQVGADMPIWDTSCAVFVGTVSDPSTPISFSVSSALSFGRASSLMVVRPERPIVFDGRNVVGVDATTTVPGLSGTGSGAVGVAFFASGLGGGYGGGTWPSPWTSVDLEGTYFLINMGIQQGVTIGSTPAITSYQSKAWVLGLGMG